MNVRTKFGKNGENYSVKGKGKGCIQLLMDIHLTATEYHMPYGITQCYLPPNTSEHIPPDRLVGLLELPTPEGWKAELT